MNTGAIYKVDDSSYEIMRINTVKLVLYQAFIMIMMVTGFYG